MRKYLLVVPFIFVGLWSCQSTPADLTAFKALQVDMAIIGPEYQAYVTADPKYEGNPDARDQRVKLVNDINRLLAEKVK